MSAPRFHVPPRKWPERSQAGGLSQGPSGSRWPVKRHTGRSKSGRPASIKTYRGESEGERFAHDPTSLIVEAGKEQHSRFRAHELEKLLALHPTTEDDAIIYPELPSQSMKTRFVRAGSEDHKLPVREMLHGPDCQRATLPVQEPPREKRNGRPFHREASLFRNDIDSDVGEDLHLPAVP